MGQVYLAKTTGLGGFERHVVVKTLDVEADDDQFVTMFLDEARLVGALHHQYITPVYEVGCDEDGRYFLVMDYVHGETAEAVWKRCLEDGAAIPLGFVLTAVIAVASALHYAHCLCAPDGTPLAIVHRDVSLSNVMIGYDGGVRLIDFGIAKSSNRVTRTQVGTLKGKFGYLSPEQVLRKAVDHRTDIFALGIVLYELSTMARAFLGSSDLLTLEKITKGELTPPSQLVADYPPELEAIVLKALAVDPRDRYATAADLARALEELAHARDITLGDPAIVTEMRRFERPQPGNRRLAKSSGMVQTDRKLIAQLQAEEDADADAEVIPSRPRDSRDLERLAADEEDTPVIAALPVTAVHASNIPQQVDDDLTIPVQAPYDTVSPLVVNFAQMSRAQTATAELLRREQRRVRGVWIACTLLALAIVIALALGLS